MEIEEAKPYMGDVILKIDDELVELCRQIQARNLSNLEWAAIESDDEFHTAHYYGGYDADEEAFCFSFYPNLQTQYWFQITLDQVADISKGAKTDLEARLAR